MRARSLALRKAAALTSLPWAAMNNKERDETDKQRLPGTSTSAERAKSASEKR